MGAIKFFIEGIRRFKEVGAIARTSKFVSKAMCKYIDFNTTKCIVELGAGDGSITEQILKQMSPDTKLLAFEINDKLSADLREKLGNDPRLVIIQDDAKKMGEYIRQAGFDLADAVISAIPFSIIPEDDIIEEAKKQMRMNAKFVQLHYSLVAKKRYKRIFNNVDIDFVTLNVPPAFIHICEKLDEA